MPRTYNIEQPKLTDEEKSFVENLKSALFKTVSDSDLQKIFLVDDDRARFISDVKSAGTGMVLMPYDLDLVRSKAEEFVKKYLGSVREELVDVVLSYMFSFGSISSLLVDPKVEEVMINGVNTPVYIAHRDFGICRTNLVIDTEDELNWLVDRFLTAGHIHDKGRRVYDGSLEDSTRFNIVTPPVSRSPIITLRRFTPQPFSILELVKNNTLNLDMAAFLWLAVEGMRVRPANLLIVGGASSGKTTTLNALLGFVPPGTRVITIEDVPELNLANRENVVSMYTHYDKDERKSVTLQDLVKASLRMRPDRVIVGEVRGGEAEDLFVAMDIGCAGSMGTLHANSARETILRLTTPPMNVPKSMIPLVDLIIVQQRVNVPGKGLIRRVTEIVEVGHIDNINLTSIFRWIPETDSFAKSEIPPTYLDKLAKVTGRSKPDLLRELAVRKGMLSDMINAGKTSFNTLYPELNQMLYGGVELG